MSSVKVLLYTSKKLKNGEHPIMLRVIKDRKPKYISIGHSCTSELWDKAEGKPKKKHPFEKEINILIEVKKAEAYKLILENQIEDKEYSSEEIIEKISRKFNKCMVLEYFDILISRFKNANRIGNANVYKSTKNSLSRYRENKDFQFSDINYNFLIRYEESFLKRGVSLNSIFVAMRTFKTLVNFAKKDGLVRKDFDPFVEYSFKKFRGIVTKKRALSKVEIKSIESQVYIKGTSVYNAQQYFMFSFYCRGINFIDMAFLKWEDIKNDRLEYIRKKTKKRLTIGLLEPALRILEYYNENYFDGEDGYVFPILKRTHITPQSIENRTTKILRIVNEDLKLIADECNISIPLTTYVARHSYATIMKRSGASTSIISESMGHESERITQVYLDSFGNEVLDEVNRLIL